MQQQASRSAASTTAIGTAIAAAKAPGERPVSAAHGHNMIELGLGNGARRSVAEGH